MATTRMCLHCGLPIENPYGQQRYHTMANGGRDCGREHHVAMQKERRRMNRGAVVKQCFVDGVLFSTYDRRENECSDACRKIAAVRRKGN